MSWDANQVKFVLAVRVLGYMWQSQQHGKGLLVRDMLRQMPTVDEENLRDVLLDLEKAGFVARTTRRDWMLVYDMDEMTLLDLYRSGDFSLPEPAGKWVEVDGWSNRLADVLVDIDRQIESDMDCSLKSLFKTAPQMDKQSDGEAEVHRLVSDYSAEEQEEFEVTGQVKSK